jgi:hypothetical protein
VIRSTAGADAAKHSPKKIKEATVQRTRDDHDSRSSTGPEKLRADEGPSQDDCPVQVELAAGSGDNVDTELLNVGLSLLR